MKYTKISILCTLSFFTFGYINAITITNATNEPIRIEGFHSKYPKETIYTNGGLYFSHVVGPRQQTTFPRHFESHPNFALMAKPVNGEGNIIAESGELQDQDTHVTFRRITKKGEGRKHHFQVGK